MTIRHLDTEALSAALDSAATADEKAHLATCAYCQAEMASLAAVAQAVGAPVEPRSPTEVDGAIERALALWDLSAARHQESVAAAFGALSAPPDGPRHTIPSPTPTPTPTPSTASGVSTGRHARRGGSSRWLVPVAGIAAAVLVVGGLVAVARLSSNHSATTSSVAGAARVTTRPSFSAAPPGAASGTGSATPSASGGDLGDQSDPGVVARLVIAAVSPPRSASALAPNVATTTVPKGSSTRDLVPVRCAIQARAAVGLPVDSSAPIEFVATLRWRGQAAVTVVFSAPAGLAGAVMQVSDCSLLVVLPF